MIRIYFLAVFFLTGSLAYSQENYELLFIRGEYDKILQSSNGLLSPDDYFYTSLVHDKQGETLKAIAVLQDGLNKFANNQMLEVLLIEYLFKTGQYAQTKPLLITHLDSPGMFLRYINILGFEGDYALAVDSLNEKVKTDSLHIEYLSLLGEFYYQMDSLKASINAMEKLITINPHDQKNLHKLAGIYIKNKDFEQATELCDRVLVKDSLNKKFNRIKGIAAFNNANFEIAAPCFQLLMDQGDSSAFVLKHLGISEFKNKRFDFSREFLLSAYQRDSTDLEINYYLGKAYLNSPTPQEGLFYLNRVDSLMQPDPKIISSLYYDKQSIYSATGQYHEALKCYELAYQYNPRPEYIFYIASLYQHKLNNSRKALEYFEQFLALLPPKPESEYRNDGNQVTVSLRKLAESNIVALKEEMFFKGE